MPSPEHEHYLEVVAQSIRQFAQTPTVLQDIKFHLDTMLLLSVIDLGPAMPILERCYAEIARGSQRKDPLALLRMLLLGSCIGVMKINALVKRLRHSPVLATLAGFPPDAEGKSTVPSVATVYELLHRLHDGPVRRIRGAVRPSIQEYRATQASMAPSVRHGKEANDDPASAAKGDVPPKVKATKKASKSEKKKDPCQTYRNRSRNTAKVTEALRVALVKEDSNSLPDDLPTRLLEILHAVVVGPSAAAGLLGDIKSLLLAGDGSALETNADGHGKKVDSCPHSRWERCDCPRTYADPDAARGWDHYEKKHFFGYFYYEIVSVGSKSELPMFIDLNPANTHDSIAAMKALSTLTRFYHRSPEGTKIDTFIADCGHDGEPLHHYLYQNLGIKPVIPISGEVPAVHPLREDVRLDPSTAVPLCKAGCPMASWGTAGEGKTSFICPLKAGKIEKCPLAPENEPAWSCRPELSYGPTIVLNVADNARLFPVIARNSKKYTDTYNKRGACERTNAFNNTTCNIEDCGHRRWSFWLIRLYILAIIKHAKAWVARMDAEAYLRKILGLDEVSAAA